jgi:hypothetical protein
MTQADTASKDAQEIRRLRSVHELYDRYKKEWDLCLSAYEGGPDFANAENLHRHPREHEEDFKERANRVHYQNYCDVLVDFFTDFIYAETIQRDGGTNSDFYTKFLTDVNKKGEDITTVMRDVSDDKDILGMIYGLVDTPRVEVGRPLTKAEEEQLGITPYWVIIRPMEMLDWVTDQFDRFQYAKRQQFLDEYVNGRKRALERYTEWTPQETVVTDIDITDGTDEKKAKLLPPVVIKNVLGEVPLRVARYRRSKKDRFMAKPFLRDMASNNREVMNLTSLEQEFLYRQCFNILAQEVDTNIPLKDQQQGNLGTSNTLLYPKGAKVPQYITPSSDPADKIAKARVAIVQEMFKRAAQDTVNELFNGQGASGFSKSQSFKTTVPRIATRADALEHFENEMMALTMKYLGKTWDGSVKYKDHYEITNITDALSQLTALFRDLQLPSETFVKTELKRMVHEVDGKLTAEDKLKIEGEIDAMNFPEWQKTMKAALIGAPKPVTTKPSGSGGPVAGKDTPTKPSTPQRAQGTSAEIQKESRSK